MDVKKTNKNYYQLKVSEALDRLKSSKNGLSEKEAKRRLAKFGPNKLREEKPVSWARILLAQFSNVLVYVILAAAGISLFLRRFSDAVFILMVLVLNIAVGFVQEYKAEKTLKELKNMEARAATVLRGGQTKQINALSVTIGDIIILKAGDIIPADARVIYSDNLRINESNLTGESYPALKFRDIIEKETLISDRKNMVFAGTFVSEGVGRAVVSAIGENTEFGKIAEMTGKIKKSKTPLRKKISDLSLILGAVILAIVGAIFLLGILKNYNVYETFIASISLAVSVIPEELLPAITIILVLGMRRIFKKKALVKRLSATETLGGTTTICLDKTGTLTEGKMIVSHVLSGSKEKLLQIASLVGEAFIENPDDELSKWIFRGRPTDKALLEAAVESGISIKETHQKFKEIESLLFDSENKYALRIFFNKESGDYFLFAMGAPEALLEKSGNIQMFGDYDLATENKINQVEQKVSELAEKGLRVVACAEKNLGKKFTKDKMGELFEDMSFLGLIALKDPLRKDAAFAMRVALRAGIRPIIVTGDHALTAKAIAEEIGFSAKKSEIFEGADIDKISEDELAKIAAKAKIFARVSPEHKLKIVRALKQNGEVVAMTGDGVNDAPALKMSDIGIALGSGTEVSKETADIVLLDDNFKVIVDAIEEGRNIFENVRKVLVYLIADDSSELLLFLAALIFGMPLPLFPAQILWINIIEDGFPNVALTMEKKERELMAENPRDPQEAILNGDMKKWSIVVAVVSFLAALAAFIFFWRTSGNLAKARTAAFALMSLDSLAFAYSVRSFRKTFLRRDIFENHLLNWSVIFGAFALAAAIYIPIMQKFIQTAPLKAFDWGIILLFIAVEILIIDKFKVKIMGTDFHG